ncbi:hypothetical protein [Paracoccus alkanivorans]|uniref:hypothetical protein n=1 Tax=Paracoccus alkanivorans TaxID=2116655 RepID=UPI0011C48F7D|nr:hypothetical protein [Paracoccus alkanivorans]
MRNRLNLLWFNIIIKFHRLKNELCSAKYERDYIIFFDDDISDDIRVVSRPAHISSLLRASIFAPDFPQINSMRTVFFDFTTFTQAPPLPNRTQSERSLQGFASSSAIEISGTISPVLKFTADGFESEFFNTIPHHYRVFAKECLGSFRKLPYPFYFGSNILWTMLPGKYPASGEIVMFSINAIIKFIEREFHGEKITTAEATLLCKLISGHLLEDIARDSHKSISTLRTQSRRIREKIEIKRISNLDFLVGFRLVFLSRNKENRLTILTEPPA